MPQQTAPRSTGAFASAGHQLPRRLPLQRDGTRGPLRSHEEREEEVRLARKVFRAAGVQQPEVHARRLVDLREMDDADYAPASAAWQGSAAGAREQLELLRDRLQEIRTLRADLARRTSIDMPRVVDADTLWARQVRRDQPEQFGVLDRHAAEARENLARAKHNGADEQTIAGLRTAVDVTTHQVRRAELAAQRGEKWETFQKVQKLAPQMLADLDRREQTLLAEHEASLSAAIKASNDPMQERYARPAPQLEAEPAYAGPQLRM